MSDKWSVVHCEPRERVLATGVRSNPQVQDLGVASESQKEKGEQVGHDKGISMEEEKVRAIQEWPAPKSVKDIQSFLGFANFYQQFIPDYSAVVRLLHALTQKDSKWVWGPDQQATFKEIKM